MLPRTNGGSCPSRGFEVFTGVATIYLLTVIFDVVIIEDICGWSSPTGRTTSLLKRRRYDYDSSPCNVGNTRRCKLYYSISSALENYQNTRPILLPNVNEVCIDWMDLNHLPQQDEVSNFRFNYSGQDVNRNINVFNTVSSDQVDTYVDQQYHAQEFMVARMPVYPIPSVTVPDVTNHNVTFWNVERRNIRMVLDLEEKGMTAPQLDQLMCVVLQAKDTGRIASIGTVVRILHFEKELRYDNTELDIQRYESNETLNYRRIVVTCVPVGIANKIQIINPIVSTREHRFRHPDDYLTALIMCRNVSNSIDVITDNESMKSICSHIQSDLNVVFLLYRNDRIVTCNWPPIMVSRIQSMADFDDVGFVFELTSLHSDTQIFTPTLFWSIAQLWQSLCETVRAAHEMMMISERNEYMVEAAIRNGRGGPLQLPVHMEDLLPSERRYIEQKERIAQEQWVQLQLDPCIDFQNLLSLQRDFDRYYYLSQMIARERLRLEDVTRSATNRNIETTPTSNGDEGNPFIKTNDAPVRKGAWFNDEYW